MATRPVRFEFHCENASEKLKYVHHIPRSLVTAAAQTAQNDAVYINVFVNTLQPILKEHEVACRAASNPLCGNCGSPTNPPLTDDFNCRRRWQCLMAEYPGRYYDISIAQFHNT